MTSVVHRVVVAPALVVALALALVLAPALAPGSAAVEPPRPAPGTAWFGPALAWQNDSADSYELRLGADASLFGRTIGYPLNATSLLLLRDLSAQSAAAAAVGVLSIEPADLTQVGEQDAADLASAVASATEQDGSVLLLRFAPEMNGSWTSWGRRPVTYVAAFRELADAVHEATDAAAMVWSPAYGAGYPYTAAISSTTTLGPAAPPFDRRNLPYLDTDGDGAVTSADDPYEPYYPGDEYVDWVGLTMLRYGVGRRSGANTVPAPGELDARFKERFGYDDDRRRATFYVRYAGSRQQPFLLATGAAYDPSRGGASEEAVKQAWLKQVVRAPATRPMLWAVQWLEESRAEPAAGGTVDWQLTAQPGVASVSRALLEQGGVSLGPLAGVGTGAGASPGAGAGAGAGAGSEGLSEPQDEVAAADTGGFPPFLAGVLATLAVVLGAAVVAVRIHRRRSVPPWLR